MKDSKKPRIKTSGKKVASAKPGNATTPKVAATNEVKVPPKPKGKDNCNCRLEWVCDT